MHFRKNNAHFAHAEDYAFYIQCSETVISHATTLQQCHFMSHVCDFDYTITKFGNQVLNKTATLSLVAFKPRPS